MHARDMLGPYRLEDPLGNGAMGEVWRAVDTRHHNRIVALKIIGGWHGEDQDVITRFKAECAIAGSLTNPHIIPIYDYGQIGRQLYLVMPLVEGRDLEKVIRQDGPLPPWRAMSIVDQVAEALDVAHRAGVLHRDVKPSNIMITSRDTAYLVDFGLARALAGGSSMSVAGTVAYMAPERFKGLGDHRADIYALTCVLYEILTGRPPFEAEDLPGFVRAHSELPPPRPSASRQDFPLLLDHVIARGMAKTATARYGTAGELAAAAEAAFASDHQSAQGIAGTGRQETRQSENNRLAIKPNAVIVAVGAFLLFAACVHFGGGSNGGTTVTSTNTPTNTPVYPAPIAPTEEPRINPTAWTGHVRIGSSGISFTSVPPNSADGPATIQYNQPGIGPKFFFRNSGPSAAWSSTSDPTYEQCVSQVQTQPLSDGETFGIQFRPGLAWCITGGNSDYLTFIRPLSRDGEAVQANAIMWLKQKK